MSKKKKTPKIPKLTVLIEDARYFSDQGCFVLKIKDVESGRSCDRPLQITKTAMLMAAGVDPEAEVVDNDTLHWYANLLRDRGRRGEPITLESPEEDEMTPFLEQALDEMKESEEARYGPGKFDKWKKEQTSGLFLPS